MTFTTRTFGIEIEAKGLSHYEVQEILERNGIDCFRTNYYDHSSTRRWKIKPDGSVTNGFEVVSPVLQGEEGIALTRKVLTTLEQAGATVDRQCGIHVHYGVNDWDLSQWKNIFKQYVKFEDALDSILPASRRLSSNRFIRGFTSTSTVHQNFKMDNIDDARSLRDLFNTAQSGSRYYKLNAASFWSHGTIEFRHHSGSVDADKVEAWLRLTSGMIQMADRKVTQKKWRGTFDQGYNASYKLGYLLERLRKSDMIPTETSRYMKKRAKNFS
jgi:hypothetical protein